MSVLFVADEESNIGEGIFKKICAQAKAFSIIEEQCHMINKKNGHIYYTLYCNGVIEQEKCLTVTKKTSHNRFLINLRLCCEAIKIAQNLNNEKIYIRHMMIPSVFLIKFLRIAKNNGNTIYYEIPTYPYFKEQISNSRHKVMTVLRTTVEILFWPFIYMFIDKLVVIISNNTSHRFNKMLEITNGIDESEIQIKHNCKNDKTFRIIGVGTIFPYHGYERIILGIKKCEGILNNGGKIEFHIIGESEELENLKILTKELNLEQNVLFYNKVYGDALNKIFENMDIGVACLALFRRGANVDTTLKLIEYLARGIVCVTSGDMQKDLSSEFPIIKVKNDSSPIDINILASKTKTYSHNSLMEASNKARKMFNWKNILDDVLHAK